MEDIKHAFETIVVGLLTILWLATPVYAYFYFRKLSLKNNNGSKCSPRRKNQNEVQTVREFLECNQNSFALIATLIIGLAYCLGTIVFPLADELFNKNRTILGIRIKNDEDIRTDVMSKLYFKDKFYDLSLENFQMSSEGKTNDLPQVAKAIANINDCKGLLQYLNRINKEEKDKEFDSLNLFDIHTEDETKSNIYKYFNDHFHAIYNYQKYSDFKTAGSDEVLTPLRSRIVVLRGAVFNGICLLILLLIITVTAPTLKIIFSDLFDRNRAKDWSKLILPFLVLCFLTFAVWVFCYFGAWGVTEAEKEYDKHIVGLFHGRKEEDKTADENKNKTSDNANKKEAKTSRSPEKKTN